MALSIRTTSLGIKVLLDMDPITVTRGVVVELLFSDGTVLVNLSKLFLGSVIMITGRWIP